jgi:hypothetical protein
MKKLMLWIIAICLSGRLLPAQNLVGVWQGTLQTETQLRIVSKISTTDAGALKAVMYSIDQGGQATNATTITLQGSIFKMTIAAIGGTYEGTLSADGNSIAGIWTQGAKPLPLTLQRATPETAWAIPEPDWRESIQRAILSHCKLTKATADKSAIVAAGSVIALKKDNLVLYSTANRYPPSDSYVNGTIKPGLMSGAFLRTGNARAFVAGEKLWLTRISFEPKNEGVLLEFLSDQFDDARYWGTLKFSFAKGSSPPGPEELLRTVTQVIGVEPAAAPVEETVATAAAGLQAVEAPPPAVEVLSPIPPPPPPPDQPVAPPPTVALNMTKDQVIAIMGQPIRIGNLGAKQIYIYKDFKVTLTGGKVTNIE